MALIEFNNFSFAYMNSDGTESQVKSLDNINLEIDYGDFVLLCGPSGCGKTTLLTNLKKELMPAGRRAGEIRFNGTEIQNLDEISSACDIGYLFQNPDSQIVTDTVIQEIAFPLENIGLPTEEIRNRISEIVAFFGINDILHKNVNELSGGQKQLVNLCSLLVLRPQVLLLDEPMSQLDPIASYEFLSIVRRLNEEFSITVIMSEHKADSIFPFIDKAVFLKEGKIEFVDNAHNICSEVIDDEIFENYLPAVTKIYNSLSVRYPSLIKLNTPLSIREGRRCLNTIHDDLIKISNSDVSFNKESYEKLLKMTNEEFIESDILNGLKFDSIEFKFKELIEFFDICDLIDKHPYDCSGGEQQKIVIVKALLQNADVLVLDEPTKGLDPISSKNLANILNSLRDNGITILMTSHDLDFVANNCKRCLMLFDKDIQIDDEPKVIFAENNFYTTFVNRMVKDYVPEIVTLDDLKDKWDLE